MSDGYLAEEEYHDYIRLFRFAADRVLRQQQMRGEIHRMTEPLIKLPSMIIKELQAEIAVHKTELESKSAELERKGAEIHCLQKLVDQLSADRHML